MRRNAQVIEHGLGRAGTSEAEGQFAVGDGDGLIGDSDKLINLRGDVVDDDEVLDLDMMRPLSMTGIAAGERDEIGAIGQGVAPGDGGASIEVDEGIEELIIDFVALPGCSRSWTSRSREWRKRRRRCRGGSRWALTPREVES